MVSRRFLVLISIITTAVSFFTARRLPRARRATPRLGRVRRQARSDPRRGAQRSSGQTRAAEVVPAGTSGGGTGRRAARADRARAREMVAEIKQELQSEMGLLPLQLLRDRRSSFVELYSDRQLRQDQLRHRRLSGQRLLRHRQARGGRAQGRRQPRAVAQDRVDQGRLQGQGDSGQARRHRRRRRRGAQRRLGDHQDAASSICRRCAPTPRSPTTSPSRSSGSATTTRRASSCRPATSGSGRRTAW